MAKLPKKSKRFQYNLTSALKFREMRETQEQEKFSKAEKKYLDELKKEEELKEQEIAEFVGLTQHLSEGKEIDFQQINMRKAHLEKLKNDIVEQVKVRETAEEEKNTQREVLVKAMKDKKILEEDKKKKREIWYKMMKKEENKFLDEIACIAYERKSKETIVEQKRAKRKARLAH